MCCHFLHAGLQVLISCALFFGMSVSLSTQEYEPVFTQGLLPQGVIETGMDPGGLPTFIEQGIELVFDFGANLCLPNINVEGSIHRQNVLLILGNFGQTCGK